MDTETQQLALVQTTGATPLAGPALVPFELLFAAQATALAMSRTSDGLLIAVNPAWSALTGIAPEQAVGHTSVALGLWVDEADRARFLQQIGGEAFLYQIRARDGAVRLVRIAAEYAGSGSRDGVDDGAALIELDQLTPQELFSRAWQDNYGSEVDEQTLKDFAELLQDVQMEDEQP